MVIFAVILVTRSKIFGGFRSGITMGGLAAMVANALIRNKE